MRTLGTILLVSVLLVWQVTARAGNAVVLKACSYQTVRDGFRMPKRILPVGAIVKVLATHGAKADIATSTGDTVSVRLANLRLLTGTPSPEPVAIQPTVGAAAPLPVPSPSPSPLPSQAAGTPDKPAERPSETGKRSAAVRCSHLLKNGQQCSRMTTSPNGLCWQHGGD